MKRLCVKLMKRLCEYSLSPNSKGFFGLFKEERIQLMIWGFTEFRANENNENFTRADVKACIYLIDFKFPPKH